MSTSSHWTCHSICDRYIGLADRTNGRAIGTVLRLSVCDAMHCGTVRPRASYYCEPIGSRI